MKTGRIEENYPKGVLKPVGVVMLSDDGGSLTRTKNLAASRSRHSEDSDSALHAEGASMSST